MRLYVRSTDLQAVEQLRCGLRKRVHFYVDGKIFEEERKRRKWSEQVKGRNSKKQIFKSGIRQKRIES
jgi:hypothetical protein